MENRSFLKIIKKKLFYCFIISLGNSYNSSYLFQVMENASVFVRYLKIVNAFMYLLHNSSKTFRYEL